MEDNSSKKGLELLTSRGIRFNSICSFTESQFGYCPLLWMLHSRGVNDKINHLHRQSLRIVCKDNISSFEGLLKRDKSFVIDQTTNIQSTVTELFEDAIALSFLH